MEDKKVKINCFIDEQNKTTMYKSIIKAEDFPECLAPAHTLLTFDHNIELSDDEKEVLCDIISLIHCFAMRNYSKRRKKKLSLISEDLTLELDYK